MTVPWLDSRFIGDYFGGRAVELAGRVIDPLYQAQGIGSALLQDYLSHNPVEFITTYTRNPAVIKMIARTAMTMFPLHESTELREVALVLKNATLLSDGAVYHVNRYDENGLFQAADPADRVYKNGTSLKEQFVGLQNIRSALLIAARTRKDTK